MSIYIIDMEVDSQRMRNYKSLQPQLVYYFSLLHFNGILIMGSLDSSRYFINSLRPSFE